MRKIRLVLFSLVIALVLAGCVKSPSVSVKDEPKAEPPKAKTAASQPEIVKPVFVTPKIPDSKTWASLGKTRTGETFYNKTVVAKSADVIFVSTYKIVTDDVRKQTIEDVRKYDSDKAGKYARYEHDVRVDEIDCKNGRFRVKEVTHYDNAGNVLDSYSYSNEPWKGIPVLTGLDTLREKFCASRKKPVAVKRKK